MAKVLRCGDREFELGMRTYIMGVLNITPDSFSDGGRFMDPMVAVAHAKRMVDEGADIIDIGGESTRPGADLVLLDEERRRVLPVIKHLATEIDVPISIDTYKPEVAKEALELGATMVNDISGLRGSNKMAPLVADTGAALVVMHMQGEPRNMQADPTYEDVVGEILDFLKARTETALEAGVQKDRIVVDPGTGFGKTVDHNLEILAGVGRFRELGYPVMIGTSRKSFIGLILDSEPDDRLEGTIASNVAAVMGGADFVRVHDVKEMSRAMTLTDLIIKASRK